MSTTTATFTTEQPSPPPQSPPPPHYHHEYYGPPPVTAVLITFILLLFFVGFFSFYFCKCFMENVERAANNHQTHTGSPVDPPVTEPSGLDPAIINSFPTFPYNSVKSYRREKYGLECAICLCEFDDHDLLRLLTRCCHVFHQECIDLWLESHKSCPVCRRSLDEAASAAVEKLSEREIAPPASNEETIGGSVVDDTFSIVMIKDDEEEVHGRVARSGLVPQHPLDGEGKFSRSHSTGHSIMRKSPTAAEAEAEAGRGRGGEGVVVVEVEDRYTLRLPEHVKEMITRRHQATLSCTTFGEFEKNVSRKHCCFGEISGSCPACGDHFDKV